jgi:hypothetical protein
MGDEIASGRIKYWIRDRSLKLKLHVIVGRQKFMNCCGKCVVIKHQIVAKFHERFRQGQDTTEEKEHSGTTRTFTDNTSAVIIASV